MIISVNYSSGQTYYFPLGIAKLVQMFFFIFTLESGQFLIEQQGQLIINKPSNICVTPDHLTWGHFDTCTFYSQTLIVKMFL